MGIGFWARYLMPLSVYASTILLLLVGWNNYITRPPQGSIIPKAFLAFWVGLKSWDIDKGKPSYFSAEPNAQPNVPWDDHFIDELKVSLVACRVLYVYSIHSHRANVDANVSQCHVVSVAHGNPNPVHLSSNSCSPIFWTCMGQISGNTVSLAANMNTYSLPNDFRQ
ncbi:peptide transporter ptr2 [Apiospora saccharicola]|uniref:Peptide transporter ptr2 n=1 Tax=Apiospora saccharicola TaxID=335842 RepID=A0ABR1W0U1_9PEZI